MNDEDNNMAPEKDERLFNFLVARSQTRITTTLMIATIAPSVSLLLFVLNFQSLPIVEGFQGENIIVLTKLMGILFPLIGFAYYEITLQTIHRDDNIQINKIIESRYNKEVKKKVHKIIIAGQKQSVSTGILWRFFMVMPILAWLSFFVDFDPLGIFLMIIIAVSAIIGLHYTYECRKTKTESEND